MKSLGNNQEYLDISQENNSILKHLNFPKSELIESKPQNRLLSLVDNSKTIQPKKKSKEGQGSQIQREETGKNIQKKVSLNKMNYSFTKNISKFSMNNSQNQKLSRDPEEQLLVLCLKKVIYEDQKKIKQLQSNNQNLRRELKSKESEVAQLKEDLQRNCSLKREFQVQYKEFMTNDRQELEQQLKETESQNIKAFLENIDRQNEVFKQQN